MERNNNILIHCNYNPLTSYGGIERVVMRLIGILDEWGCRISCISADTNSERRTVGSCEYIFRKTLWKMAGAPVTSLGNIALCKAAAGKRVIFFQEPYPTLWPAIVVIRAVLRIPVVVIVHADPEASGLVHLLYAKLRYVLFSGCVCVTTSRSIAERIDMGPKLKPRIIPLCTREELPDAERLEVNGLPDDFVLYVGRLAAYKGIDVLIDAAMATPTISYVVAGSGPLAERVTHAIREQGCSNITFVNRSISEGEKDYLIHRSRFVVFPSTTRNEAFGLVQLEAMRARRALVNTQLETGVNDVAPHMVCALTVPPRDAVSLRTAIERLWQDRALAEQLGVAGRERYATLFSEETFRGSWMTLLDELSESGVLPTRKRQTEAVDPKRELGNVSLSKDRKEQNAC
ncbi:MAG: glycosyltransferase [Nevskiaceae bacterium]|nr:MAG: glycosyltransferase [Nevskiaceae bacterium]TBR74858.1 MAG: glycosyltransferase [Nevskiaceae bacterium]